MDQIVGRIEDVNAQSGLKPVLWLTVALNSKYESAFDLTAIASRAYVAFSEGGQGPQTGTNYVGEAYVDGSLATILPGEGGSLRILIPMDFEILDGIEELRAGRDVVISLLVAFKGTERRQDGMVGSRTVGGYISDARSSGQPQLLMVVAKSRWDELLKYLGYSKSVREPQRELSRTIEEAREAKRQAEEAAKAAREASALTAVASLSQAYLEEAKVLGRRSLYWLLLSAGVAAAGVYLMSLYVAASLGDKFTLPEAVIRAIVIAAVFGVFTLCLRIYEAYRHLEVVNRHRVNIGRTFEAFKAAQPTEKAKEVMAAITADNMLAFGKSGFGGKDSPNQGPWAGATELVKAILDKH